MSKNRFKVRDSFKLRNSITISAVVITILIISVCNFVFMDNIYYIHVKKQLIRASNEISVLDLKDKKINSTLSDIESAYNIYIEMYYPRDKLIYTSENNDSVYENSQVSNNNEMKPRIMKILEHKELSPDSYYEVRQEYFATAKYIVYGTYLDNSAAIELYYSMDTMLSNSHTTSVMIFLFLLVMLAIFLLVIILYTLTFTVPLVKINNTTKKISKMDFSSVCPSFRIKELNELSLSVNSLSSSLDASMKELKKQNRRLELEIEKQKMLEESIKQFIANASHELKTPIAIIQGYAEGLKFGITNGNPVEYCEIIIDEANKMSDLVYDLLEATRYENVNYEPVFVDFPLAEKIEQLVEERRSFFCSKGITVTSTVNKGFVASADMMLFERVFSNYFSNAVSHAEFEKLIKISCEQVDECYRISVFNTGKPISDEDIGKIWNSFYRADKSHSRAEGRFGLGLSIVSNAQRLQGAKYGVVNHENGVEFWFDVIIK